MSLTAQTVTNYYEGILRQVPTTAQVNSYISLYATTTELTDALLGQANVQVDPVVRLYQAAFDRVPESDGLTYWVNEYTTNGGNQSLANMALGFSLSQEFQDDYGGFINATPPDYRAYVSALYVNVLGRAGETAGVEYWTNKLTTGAKSVSTVLLEFSQSKEFSDTVGDAIDNYLTQCGQYQNGDIATPPYSGTIWDFGSFGATYTLTTSIDNFTGTQYNDTFNAALAVNPSTGLPASQTLNAGDSLNGNGGVDTLNAQLNTNVTPAQLSNIEVVNATALADVTLGLANAAQLTNINNSSSDHNLTVTGIAANAALGVTNVAGNLSTTFTYATTTGSSDVANLTVNAVGTMDDWPVDPTGVVHTVNIAGVETINVTADTNASNIRVNGGATVNAYTFAGAADLDFSTDSTGVELFDGSDATGDLELHINAQTAATAKVSVYSGSGNDIVVIENLDLAPKDLLVELGSGADVLVVNGGHVASTDTFVGGLGDDELSLTAAVTTTTIGARFDGFEILEASNSMTQNLTVFGNSTFTELENGSSAGTVTFSSASADVDTLSVYASTTTTMSRAADTSADSLTISLTDNDTATAITVNDEESITITSNKVVAVGTVTNAVGSLSATDLTSLTITGNANLGNATGPVANTVTAAALASVDATELLGALNLDVSSSAVNLTADLGVGNSSLVSGSGNDVLNGGAGNDTIKGGVGNDTITAGAGADVLWGDAGSNQLNGGEGNDSIYAGTGNDSITAGGGNDSIYFGTDANNGALTTNDTIVGDGTDTLVLGADGDTLVDANFTNVTGIQTIRSAGNTSDLNLTLSTQADESGLSAISAVNGSTVYSSAITATADSNFNNAVTITAGSGAENIDFSGSTSAVTLNIAASNLVASDTIKGGTGSADILNITADDGTAFLANVSGFETINILASTTPAQDATLDATGWTVAAGTTVNVDATALTLSNANFNLIDTAIAGNLSVQSGAGTDTIYGGAGNDTVYGNSGADTVYGQTGNDSLLGGEGADSVYGGEGNDAIDGGNAADSLYGGAGNDAIVNGAGNDKSNGDAGNDTITAGSGNDTIFGGAGTDSLVGGTGNDVFGYTVLTDSTEVSGATFTGDTIDGFDFAADKFSLNTTVGSIGTVTVGTAALTSLTATLAADANLTNVLNSGSYPSTALLTISAGTAAGTYMVISANGGAYNSAEDALIKLVNAANTGSYGTANFTTGGGEVFVVSSGNTFSVNTNSGAITSSQTGAPATAAAAITAGYNAVLAESGATTPTVDASANVSANTFHFGTGVLSGADNASTNSLAYSGITQFNAGTAGSTVTLSGAGQNVAGNSGVDTVITATGITGTLALAGGANVLNVGSTQNISGATVTAVGGTYNLNLLDGGAAFSATVSSAELTGASNVTTTGVGAVTITANNAVVAGYTVDADIDTLNLGNFANSVTLLASSAQTINGGSAVDTVRTANGITGSLALAGGANVVSVGTTQNISGATVSATGGSYSLELVDGGVAFSATVSAAELTGASGVTTTGGGATTVTLSNALTGYTIDADIDTLVLANATNSVTLGQLAQSVTGVGGDDTVAVGALAATGTLALAAGTNVVTLGQGGSLYAATVSAVGGTWGLTLADGAGVTLRTSDLTGATATAGITAAGSESVNVNTTSDGALTSYTLDSDVETWFIGTTGNGNNSVTLGAVGQSVTFGTGNDTVTTINGITGTLTLGAGTNVVTIGNSQNISGATVSATGGSYSLELVDGGVAFSATVSAAELTGASGVTTTGGGATTVTLSNALTGYTIDGDIDTLVLANAVNSVTMTNANGQAVTAGNLADTITTTVTGANVYTANLSAGGADTVVVINAAINAGTSTMTISGFDEADDVFVSQLATASISDGGFVGVTIAGTNIGTNNSVVALDSSIYTLGTLTNENAVQDEIESLNFTTSLGGNGDFTFLVYNSTAANASAGVYQVNMSNAGAVNSIELIGVVSQVGADALTGLNFA